MKIISLVFCFCILISAGVAQADVVSMVGDNDCFGLGGTCPDGSRFVTDLGGTFFQSYQGPGDGPYTDLWNDFGSVTFNHAYSLPGGISAATLVIRIAGIHDINQTQIYDVSFDGTVIGDIPVNYDAYNYQEVLTYTWNVPTNLLTGNDTVSWSGTGTDGYIIDFSELKIQASGMPEPGTLILLGSGLAGMFGLRRRINR